MTDLAAWIASKRAASEGATPGDWQVDDEYIVHANHPDRLYVVAEAEDRGDARHIAAFDPATTRRLLDAVEALDALLLDVQDYPAWERPCAAVDRAKAALDALRGGDHG